MRAEWRSVWRGSGGLCVTVGGTKERHWWYAGRVDLEKEVGMSSPDSFVLVNNPALHLCLSLTAGATFLTGAYFGEGSGPVLGYISCSTGRESNISECSMGTVGAVNCHHGRDAAVRCQCKIFTVSCF